MNAEIARARATLSTLLRQLSWPELRHHPWRNAAALLAVMLGVALAFSVHLINASALSEFGAAVRAVNGEPDLELRRRTRGGLRRGAVRARRRAPAGRDRQPGGRGRHLRASTPPASACALRVVGVDALVVAALLRRRCCRAPADAADRFAMLDPGAAVPQRRRRSAALGRAERGPRSRCRRQRAASRCASPAASPPAGRRWR